MMGHGSVGPRPDYEAPRLLRLQEPRAVLAACRQGADVDINFCFDGLGASNSCGDGQSVGAPNVCLLGSGPN